METKAKLDSDVRAVVRNVQNNDLYVHLFGNKFRNIRTGVVGEVSDEVAKKVFRINMEMTEIISKYPNIELLISKLQLKIKK